MKPTRLATMLLATVAAAIGCGGGASMMDASVGPTMDAAAAGGCMPVKATAVESALVAAGMKLVQMNKCQQCHGSGLSGNFDGIYFPGHAMPAYPPNLTPDPATGLGCWTDAQISDAILNGNDNQRQPICPPMPHFSAKGLTQADARSIVAFLRSLSPTVNQVPSGATCGPWGTLGGGCMVSSDCPLGAICSFQFCISDDGSGGDAGTR